MEVEVTDTDRADDSMLQQQLHGDMLECVLLRVPPDELTASAALVSSEWRRAARAVHQRQRQRQRHRGAVVSLVAHIQGASIGRSTHVYDRRSRTWASDDKMVPAHLQVLPVRRCACAGGDRVYTLSLASMTLSVDALGTAWRELPPPRVWRVDPVVAAVGARVVLLGGACGAMASAGVVEVVNHEHAGSGWAMCAPMPAPLACASSGRWVSAAASERRVYVVERRTGWASWFDPSARQWGPTRRLQQPDTDTDTDTASDDTGMIRSWATCGVSRGDERLLILLATGSCSSDGLRVVLWSVDGETLLAREDEQGTMAEMPAEMSEKLFGGGLRTAAASIINIGAVAGSSSGGYYCGGYVYNASEPNNGAVLYELEGDDHELGVVGGKKKNNETTMKKKTTSIGSSNRCRWEWLPCPPTAAAAAAAAAAQESDPFLAIVFGSAASQN